MFKIPEEKLPESLKSEERLNVLFAPLRSRSVNPKDWENKITSWKSIIKLYCESNDIYSFTLSSLNNVFIRHGRPPSCLNEVFEDMIKKGELQVIDVFLKKSSETWSGWATDVLVKRPLSWSFNKIKNSIYSSSMDQSYVHLEVVKSKCDTLFASIPQKYKNKLISLKDLLSILNKDDGHVDDVKMLIHSLANHQKLAVTHLSDSQNSVNQLEMFLIKFGDGHKVTPISEIDIGIYTLENNEKVISKHIESIEDEIENCVKEAKMHLSKNHRQMAKSCLRKKHELEKKVAKKANAFHNVQTLLEKIKDSHSDAHVWEAYKNALSAFNTTFKETGMSEDAIEDTMIQLGDVLDMHEDIQSALARPAHDADNSDLEEELAELMNAEDEGSNKPPHDDSGISDDLEKRFEKLCLNLPDVPSKTPDVTAEEVSFGVN